MKLPQADPQWFLSYDRMDLWTPVKHLIVPFFEIC
jgi:hypothetical protein